MSTAAETTRAVLGHAIHELMRNDEQMAWLRAHAEDIPATAISELLRIAAPVIQQVRTATEDFELHGQHIKAGERHWHGAKADTTMGHITITAVGGQATWG